MLERRVIFSAMSSDSILEQDRDKFLFCHPSESEGNPQLNKIDLQIERIGKELFIADPEERQLVCHILFEKVNERNHLTAGI